MYMPKGAIAEDDEEYIPKGAVLEDASSGAQENPESFGSKAEKFGSNIIDAINKAGGATGRAIGYGLADAINLPVGIANYANKKLAGLFGVNPENVPTPSEFDPKALSMPFVSQNAQQQLDPIARNATTMTEFALPAVDAAKLAVTLGKSGAQALQRALGLAASQKSKSFMDDLLQGHNFSDSHLPVLNEIRNNEKAASNASANEYKGILDEASNRGYTGGKQFPGISIDTGAKTIKPDNFSNDLDGIDLDIHSKKVRDLLTPFTKSVNNNLSFQDAHELQSELGKQGAKLQTSADGTQRYLGGELLNLRNNLKDDIVNNLYRNGDQDLADRYKAASDNFKNNVAPYWENSTIRKVVSGKGLKEFNPSNIGTVLKKDDGSIVPVANNLSDSSKNLLLANEMKSATQLLPDKKGILTRYRDPDKLVSSFGNLDNKGLAYLMTPEATAKIGSIMKDLSNQRKLKWASGVVGGLTGADIVRRYLP